MNNSLLKEENIYLFHTGKYYHSFNMMGAHLTSEDDTKGVRFTVWAPNAKQVSVIGDFNGWNSNIHLMEKISQGGLWSIFIPSIEEGNIYKYYITPSMGESIIKSDPYAYFTELRPNTASIIYDMSQYKWEDKAWIKNREELPIYDQPLNIYEVHLGSWKKNQNGSEYTYEQLAEELIPYVKDMGYTHIELLPVLEHPFDGSWGYQCLGYYSATSRYGEPRELMNFIDQCHKNGVGVVFDWVPGHFCPDADGLCRFDGNILYEKEQHKEWGTYKFDFSKSEVQSYLISNAIFLFEKYHIDGLRVDGVSSMLYLNYGKKEGEWEPNQYGGNGDLDAVEFMKQLNTVVYKYFPNVIMAAEEATSWPMITWPIDKGGLGYNYKWNMGWMNDILRYMEMDPEYRKYHHNLITFSFMYAFSENFILAISHDEVVHGKKSLIDKMPGDYWQKFANFRAFYCYLMTHPGKKLMFMGCEFAQFIEWRYYSSLDWDILNFDMHKKTQSFVKTLNKFYLKENALWENDHSWDGFQWIDADNNEQKIISFIRKNKDGETCIIVINFSPIYYERYRIGVPLKKNYELIFNGDQEAYGGTGNIHIKDYEADDISWHGLPYSIEFKLPSFAGLIFKKKDVDVPCIT